MYINLIRTVTVFMLALVSMTGNIASAQEYDNTPVSVSKEKVKVNGEICYSHVVLERQTLFSISKAYNVSIEEIYRLNPTVRETGLKKNSIIMIPVSVPVETASVPTPSVKEQEVVAIQSPEPVKETKTNSGENQAKRKKKKTHTVRWYENIDDIASKYGLTVEELMAANGLESRKLKSRMKLTIPEPGEYAVVTEENAEEVQADSTAVVHVHPEDSDSENISWWPFNRKEKVSATLLLPFKATGTSGSRSNMDFYSGVLLALKDLGDAGISTDISVHDIADGNIAAASTDMASSDLVIGPVSVSDLEKVFGLNRTKMVISPLDPRAESLVATHSNMIQAPTPHKIQYDDLAAWMKQDMKPEDRVLIIYEKGARATEGTMEMRASIDSAGLKYNTYSYSILEGRDITEPLKALMTEAGTNRILIASESEAFVNDVVRNMNVMIHNRYDVVLYAGSKIRSYETIEVENFHKTNLHVSLTYYIDYEDPKVKSFLMKYRALFNTEPTQFAFQGYDIATYFIEMCSKYGNDWERHLPSVEKSMLQSTFRCISNGEGGYVNNGVRRIIYGKDWTINKVR